MPPAFDPFHGSPESLNANAPRRATALVPDAGCCGSRPGPHDPRNHRPRTRNSPGCGAGPAGMGRVHRDQPQRLVREHRAETAPARRQDLAVQASLLPHGSAGRRL